MPLASIIAHCCRRARGQRAAARVRVLLPDLERQIAERARVDRRRRPLSTVPPGRVRFELGDQVRVVGGVAVELREPQRAEPAERQRVARAAVLVAGVTLEVVGGEPADLERTLAGRPGHEVGDGRARRRAAGSAAAAGSAGRAAAAAGPAAAGPPAAA
jgi:hypothetical protein